MAIPLDFNPSKDTSFPFYSLPVIFFNTNNHGAETGPLINTNVVQRDNTLNDTLHDENLIMAPDTPCVVIFGSYKASES